MKTVYHLRCGGIEQRTLTRETEHTVWLKTRHSEDRFKRSTLKLFPTFETAKAALVRFNETMLAQAQNRVRYATEDLAKANALTAPHEDPASFVPPPGKLAL